MRAQARGATSTTQSPVLQRRVRTGSPCTLSRARALGTTEPSQTSRRLLDQLHWWPAWTALSFSSWQYMVPAAATVVVAAGAVAMQPCSKATIERVQATLRTLDRSIVESFDVKEVNDSGWHNAFKLSVRC
jgi:hypothetical protein